MALSAEREPGREPIVIVEIDQDRCSLVYGVAPCEAELGVTGAQKCFNTLATCQDVPNFTPSTLTLRFATPSSRLPRGVTLIPSVIEVDTEPTEINIGGGDKTLSALGRRASVEITLRDHPHRDLLVDPYRTERDYDPGERGTFWSKWLARNPYYENRDIRVREGYAGQTLGEMTVRNYVIDRIDGPSRGEVKIVAKDPLRRLDADRAQAPAPSSGTVETEFDEVAASFTLLPAGVGNGEYPASGIGRIGGELFSYTRSGDTVTFVARGLRGTTAAAHDVGDSVQQVLVFEDAPIIEVIYDLITLYSGIDASFIPFVEWQAEADRWLGGFNLNAWITQPTGVGDLLNEILDQSIIFIWWSEVEQKIKLQALRPYVRAFDETPLVLSDRNNLIADSISIERKPEERVSQVWVHYDQIDPTKGLTDPANYNRRAIRRSEEAEAANQYGEIRVHEIFARWFDDSNDAAAGTVASRTLSRYVDGSVVVSFAVDAKETTLMSGRAVTLDHHGLVDFTGAPVQRDYQIVSLKPDKPGHRLECKARPVLFRSGYGFIVANGTPVYGVASAQQKSLGCWIAPDSGFFDNGDPAYRII